MKTLIHYFTGTGNTFRAAKVLAAKFTAAGIETKLHDIADGLPADLTGVSRHVFMYPTYCGTAPQMMFKYIKSAPPATGAEAAVIAVIGAAKPGDTGNAGAGPESIRKILEKSGYKVTLTAAVSYPVNWTQVMNAPDDRSCEGINAEADGIIAKIADKIVKGESAYIPLSKSGAMIIGAVGLLYRYWGRFFVGKLFVATSKCTGCGLCAQKCPAQAIRMENNRPRWKFACQTCQRCINICPAGAIQTSIIRLACAPAFFLPWAKWAGMATGYIESLVINILLLLAVDILLFKAESGSAGDWFSANISSNFRRYYPAALKEKVDGR